LINKNSSKFKLWFSAARLRTLPLSVSGIFVGSFASFTDNNFNSSIFFLAIATTISYQVLSNFANDYGDGVKGTDINRVGPKRTVQSGLITSKEMKIIIIATSIISFLLTISLVFTSFKNSPFYLLLFLILGLLAIIAAIKYTVGNNPYGYIGFGDLFVFIFFGLISVLGSNFLFTSKLNLSLLYPALTIGFLSVGVLNLNNMRDIQNDKLVGKKTMSARMGLDNSKFYHFLLISISIILMVSFLIKEKSCSLILTLLTFVNIIWLVYDLYRVYKIKDPKEFDFFLKPLVLATVFYSISLSINFAYLI
jgi:1,4-dihydroxy-2-naphthoate octaprenyltransferase|tara:strand:- start:23992 stop:24915 length:924 start_codon:yes stop_codon:yes gene_type:complete